MFARKQLFEFLDQPWLPETIRTLFTEQLSWALAFAKAHAPVAPELARVMQLTQKRRIVDLCSGAGSPPRTLRPEIEAILGEPIDIVLTDKFPSPKVVDTVSEESESRVRYVPTPVDATDVPPDLTGLRTLFEGFHHFSPDQAKKILQSAVDAGEPIAIMEVTERSIASLLMPLIIVPMTLLLAPFIRPFRPSRLLFTYVVPAILFMGAWDSIVSSLRSYSPNELREMTGELHGTPYVWRMGESRQRGMYVGWLVGYPASSEPTAEA